MTDQPQPTAPPAADLRNPIAAALEREDARNWGYDHGFENRYGVDEETDAFVDAVLAVRDAEQAALRAELERRTLMLQASRDEVERLRADRDAVLREAAALLDQMASSVDAFSSSDFGEEARAVRELASAANEFRRMADEAQQPETAPPVHLPEGGNAEDCPACRQGPPLPYPWICHGQNPAAFARRCAHVDPDLGQCTRSVDDHDLGHEYEHQRCTCSDAGDAFSPAGHYADCPHAAPAPTEEPT